MKSKLKKFEIFKIKGDKTLGGKADECFNMCEPASSNGDVWFSCIEFCRKWQA